MRHNGLTRIMVMGSWYNEDNGVNSGSGISGNDFIKYHLYSVCFEFYYVSCIVVFPKNLPKEGKD